MNMKDMEDWKSLIVVAQADDINAYGIIVQRFQDMAVGYAYSILGDFQLAEDAAQESFIEAYLCLSKLREPKAFPSWFRKIIFKQCDRLTRGKRVETVSLEVAVEISSEAKGPAEVIEAQEMKDIVLAAIAALPEHERTVTTLFYINDYSQKEVAEFLGVPVTTIDNRLRASRKRLKERMIPMVKEILSENAPSHDEKFRERLKAPFVNPEAEDPKFRAAADAVVSGDIQTLKTLLQEAPSLIKARASDGKSVTLLHFVTGCGSADVADNIAEVTKFFIAAGAEVDAGKAIDKRGGTPLAWAVSAGYREKPGQIEKMLAVAEVLIDAGAKVDGPDGDGYPMGIALFFEKVEAAELLHRRGAKVDLGFAAGLGKLDLVKSFFNADGGLKPNSGHVFYRPSAQKPMQPPTDDEILEQAFIFACLNSQFEILDLLLEKGVNINAQPIGFHICCTGLHWAINHKKKDLVEFLLSRGADVNVRDKTYNETPLSWVNRSGHKEIAKVLQQHGAIM